MSAESELSPNGGLEYYGGDDDDGPFMEENPFASEPPAWMRAEGVSNASPARAATASSPKPEAKPPLVKKEKEEAAPDNPYLHESRNLREEDGDFEIPLPKSLQGDPSLLADLEGGGDDDTAAESIVTESVVAERVDTQSASTTTAPQATEAEEAAPANPYLHESRNLREEDDDYEIPLPKSLQNNAELRAELEDDSTRPQDAKHKPAIPAADKPAANGHTNGHHGTNGHGHSNGHSNGHGNGHSLLANGKRTMQILFRPTGDIDRDKYRLKQIVDTVRDPKGRDQFVIVIKTNKETTLAFPDDPCSISDRLRNDLSKFFRVEVTVKG